MPGGSSSTQSDGGSGDFNMFQSGEGTSSGSFFGDTDGGSFFGSGPAVVEGGNPPFGSGGFGTNNKPAENDTTSSSSGPSVNLSAAAVQAKKMKSETFQKTQLSIPIHAGSVHQTPRTAPWSNPGPTFGSRQQQQLPPTKPDSVADDHLITFKDQDFKQASFGSSQQTHMAQKPISHHVLSKEVPSSQQHTFAQPPSSTQKITQQSGLGSAETLSSQTIPPQVQEQQKPSLAQTPVQSEKTSVAASDAKTMDDASEDVPPADALLRELLVMQKEQISGLLPELRGQDEKSDQILDSAGLVLKEITNYSEKLSGIKQQYCSRLSQVSSFLRMIPKTEQ